ncbi:hypothetical protein N0V86_003380 [Didymella sp. IMI 355093]|nr:hypothetical protein N0V86_003380 [Didymella sp. IMI 355093]
MLVSAFFLAGIASAAPALLSRQDNITELAPWQITAASAGSPSGRPGSGTTSSIHITIKDPNTIPLRQSATGTVAFPPIEATCSWTWEGSAADNFPDGVETVCTRTAVKPSSYGNFTVTLSGTSPRDFAFTVKETREVSPYGQSQPLESRTSILTLAERLLHTDENTNDGDRLEHDAICFLGGFPRKKRWINNCYPKDWRRASEGRATRVSLIIEDVVDISK